MAHYPDLSPWSCFGHDRLVAVGWLERSHVYERGIVEPAVLQKLKTLFGNAWQPVHSLGPHSCTLCPGWRRWLGLVPSGKHNVYVPGPGFLYVAPELVIHYIEQHGYGLPGEFAKAVLACPDMGSTAYSEAANANGPKGFSYPNP